MDPLQFAYWLQGFAELNGDAIPTKAQWKAIRDHLDTVFVKVTPKVGLPGQFMPGQVIPLQHEWAKNLQPQCQTAGDPLANRAVSIC